MTKYPVMVDCGDDITIFIHSNNEAAIEVWTLEQDPTRSSRYRKDGYTAERLRKVYDGIGHVLTIMGNRALDDMDAEKPEPGEYTGKIPWEETAAAAVFGGLLDIGTENM